MEENPKKCPYLLRVSRQKITCTGIVPGSEMHQVYPSPGLEKEDTALLCHSNYHRCPTARMLNGLHFRFQVHPCPHNDEVECLHPDQCHHCGWNPTVATARLAVFLNRLCNRVAADSQTPGQNPDKR